MNNIESCSLSLAVSVGYTWLRILPPPPEKFGAAASRILVGAPAREPNLDRAGREVPTARPSGLPGINPGIENPVKQVTTNGNGSV